MLYKYTDTKATKAAPSIPQTNRQKYYSLQVYSILLFCFVESLIILVINMAGHHHHGPPPFPPNFYMQPNQNPRILPPVKGCYENSNLGQFDNSIITRPLRQPYSTTNQNFFPHNPPFIYNSNSNFPLQQHHNFPAFPPQHTLTPPNHHDHHPKFPTYVPKKPTMANVVSSATATTSPEKQAKASIVCTTTTSPQKQAKANVVCTTTATTTTPKKKPTNGGKLLFKRKHDHHNSSCVSASAQEPTSGGNLVHKPKLVVEHDHHNSSSAGTSAQMMKDAMAAALSRIEMLAKVEAAVESVQSAMVAAGDNVLPWKLSRLVLAKLEADSWDSLGVQIRDVPSLNLLLIADAKSVKKSVETFIANWRDACEDHAGVELFEKMLEFFLLKKGSREELISICSTCPLLVLLNVAVISIKMGMWDNSSGTSQLRSELGQNLDDSIRIYVKTWKEVCQQLTVVEALEKMLELYGTDDKAVDKTRSRLRHVFSTYPLLGFLQVAVTSFKRGMWDSLCDIVQASGESEELNAQADELRGYENIDFEPIVEDPGRANKRKSKSGPGVESLVVAEIVSRASMYLAESAVLSGRGSFLDKAFMLVKQLSHCEIWLSRQYSVSEFKLLGHGDFLSFIARNFTSLQRELPKTVVGEVQEQDEKSLEVSMTSQQLILLLSQALSSLWEDDIVTKEKISELLVRQFPFISFKNFESDGIQELLDHAREHKSSTTSNSVFYSATLLGTSNYADCVRDDESSPSERLGLIGDINCIDDNLRSVNSSDAIELLLKAPFLTDLNLWSHWDILYAPSLGPLPEWLLSKVTAKGLTCLLTKDYRVIRIDHLASGDLFLQALLQLSPFHVAVQLLSLFVISGGKKHVPLSLLKCQARQGFEVIIANPTQNINFNDGPKGVNMFRELDALGSDSSMNLDKNSRGVNKAWAVVSRVVIDCLALLPSEFRCFAADVLLSGFQYLVNDVPTTMLLHCKGIEERLMLHEVGYTLGIAEWIKDHCLLSPVTDENYLISPGASSSVSGCSDLEGFDGRQPLSDELLFSAAIKCKNHSDASFGDCCLDVSDSEELMSFDHSEQAFNEQEAALVIESIRQNTFGLDLNISDVESCLLKKQHVRLGRALKFLSQELYSQDSHFILELVQNADDNVYHETVEPTLIFILQKNSVIILNNERGFTAENMRALCDVGLSTKKGSSAGYIGHRGIGFKSVFRVTDAPEVHSNGFHVKFDSSEGPIGFLLPTIVTPCNIEMFKRLACGGHDQKGTSCWNTCIVLPFKSQVAEGSAVTSVLSIHPSWLLFLCRLQCIKVWNMLDDSNIVMRKEILGDGIVKVSHGEEKMTWFVTSTQLHPKINSPDVHMTEISVALMLNETVNGDYEPILHQQPVFAFLPLRTYGLKFILQADFFLNTSREEVDGDSPWNKWLLSEFPGLFVSAEKSFCSLSFFQKNPAKAVSAFLSFVPLTGEVHGFFSGLPRMIISKLRQSNCLLQDGCRDKWVPPCKVLRGWNEQAQMLCTKTLLNEHLGLVFLQRDVDLSDALARALGIEEYGPKILVQLISSLGRTKDGIKSMGLGWLFSWLIELYSMFHSNSLSPNNSGLELDLINSLKKVPFIPLLNGTYGALDEGTIWLHDAISSRVYGELAIDDFPHLHATLRTVNPALFSKHSDAALMMNCTRMLQKIGVRLMSAHDLIRIHILPSISDDTRIDRDQQLMTEFITFVMLHLQSDCFECHGENEHIVSELRGKALILTNHGYKRPVDIPIHFNREFGNFIDASKFIHGLDYKWHEVDTMYLKHPITKSMSNGLTRWREFFQKLGVTDFVEVVLTEKSIAELSPSVLNETMCDRHIFSSKLMVKDWESPELAHILSLLSKDGSQERCNYLLEVLDALWDDHLSDKAVGFCCSNTVPTNLFFRSSLLTCISNNKWVVSSADNELHYPRELFYDCYAVRSILGCHAPYAVRKIKSIKLLTEIGFKTQVMLDDVLAILQTMGTSKSPFSASLSEMCKYYTFILKEMTTSKQQVLDALRSGPFIFVPYASVQVPEDVVAGAFRSPEEVYWHDSTGSLDHIKDTAVSVSENSIVSRRKKKKRSVEASTISLTLCSVYPDLHDFFVIGCGVNEAPSHRHYLQILQHLCSNALPQNAAKVVFQVLLVWSDGLKCGTLCPDEMTYLKKCISQLEFTVLPAMQDKWVSLHPSFGLVCWSDDDNLKKELDHSDSIAILYFGELTDNEIEMLHKQVSVLFQTLGIPSLSEIVSREVMYDGPLADSAIKIALVEWVLPFAQRFLYSLHPEQYTQLKLYGLSQMHHLRVVVVEKLFYRNTVKKCDFTSKKLSECSSLLQGNILYTAQESDPHSMFMELSQLFFDGTPNLHMANFLHMITLMARSGSTEGQIELFFLKSQKMAKLPDEESLWSLSSPLSLSKDDGVLHGNPFLATIDEQISCKSKETTAFSNWPPVGWKCGTAIRKQAVITDHSGPSGTSHFISDGMVQEKADVDLTMLKDDVVEVDGVINMGALADPINITVDSLCLQEGYKQSSGIDSLMSITPGCQQNLLTGRQGELMAFRHLTAKTVGAVVTWVNQDKETGLPYDIVVGEEESREYIEVKASRYAKKDWFRMSVNEWQFAAEKGDSFSVAHVILSGKNLAKVTVYRNPVKLCRSGKLQLAVVTPRCSQVSLSD